MILLMINVSNYTCVDWSRPPILVYPFLPPEPHTIPPLWTTHLPKLMCSLQNDTMTNPNEWIRICKPSTVLGSQMTDRPQFHVLLSVFLMTRIPPIYNANPRSMAHTGSVNRDFSKTKVKKKKKIWQAGSSRHLMIAMMQGMIWIDLIEIYHMIQLS